MNKSHVYSGAVWIVSAVAAFIYAGAGFLGWQFLGVENIVALTQSIDPHVLYALGFAVMLIEGLYIIGNFIPGSSTVMLATIAASTQSYTHLAITALCIFAGWVVASLINLSVAYIYRNTLTRPAATQLEITLKDRPLLTFYPPFRANYEVAQLMSGHSFPAVLFSTLRVKAFAGCLAVASALMIPLFIDIEQVSNEEGYTGVLVLGIIFFIIGTIQIKNAQKAVSS